MSDHQDANTAINEALKEPLTRLLAIEIERRASQRETAVLAARIEEATVAEPLTIATLATVDNGLLADYARAFIRQQTADTLRANCDRQIGELLDKFVAIQKGKGSGPGKTKPLVVLICNRDKEQGSAKAP